jgi:hypothetical protein
MESWECRSQEPMERKIAFFLVEYAPPTVEVKKPVCGKVVFSGAIRPAGPLD